MIRSLLQRFARYILRDDLQRYGDLLATGAWYIETGNAKPLLVYKMRVAAADLNPAALATTRSSLYGGVVYGEEIVAGSISASKIVQGSLSMDAAGRIIANEETDMTEEFDNDRWDQERKDRLARTKVSGKRPLFEPGTIQETRIAHIDTWSEEDRRELDIFCREASALEAKL